MKAWRFGKLLASLLILAFTPAAGCSVEHDFKGAREKYFTPLETDLTYLKDGNGRYVYLRGVNVSGSSKFPKREDPTISYVGKPFFLNEADRYFSFLSDYGFNAIRLLVTWEAIEPYGSGQYDPDQYDKEYLGFIGGIVEKAYEHGIYVLIDMHQDGFSRHLFVKYNDRPTYEDENGDEVEPEPGSLEASLLALVPDEPGGDYPEKAQGDGAPRWAVAKCLPEKNMDSEFWGTMRLLGALDEEALSEMMDLMEQVFPSGAGGGSAWLTKFVANLPPAFGFNESTDMMPWTNWGINMGLSVDIQRSFASFFAGDKIYPDYEVEGKSIKDYLQDSYVNAYLEVVKRVKIYPNVIGYDLMNEPVGIYIALTAVALYFQTGIEEGIRNFLSDILGPTLGPEVYDLLVELMILPPDRSPETIKAWGFEGADLMAILDLNYGFDQKYLQPFYEKLGNAIQEEDPDAIIWFETSLNPMMLLGGLSIGYMEINLRKPRGVRQAVYSPHFYTDIYPFFGFNQPPRDFAIDEVEFRDLKPQVKSVFDKSAYSLGNVPTVFGEFGTYFNFGGIERAIGNRYIISSLILDNYYEAFESLALSCFQWCFSPENDYRFGEGWNKEDFSLLDPDLNPRSELAWSRPHPRAMSGKPVSMHFFSDYHYFDPEKGVVNPEHEFELVFESKETDAPTEIFVPGIQYPDGFYIWLSDGYAMFDWDLSILYFFPERDEPGFVHWVRIRPPLEAEENRDWDYFARDGKLINGK